MTNHVEIEDSNLNQAIDNTNISFKERLTYDKLSFYYLSLPIMLFGNLMGALLLSAIQLHVVDLYSITIWLLVSIIMFLYGLYHYSLFRKESEKNKLKNANIWLDKYYTNTLLNGIVWGSTAFLMFPESNLLNQMIVIFFLFVMGFSSLGVLASKHDLLLTYILVIYSPILLRLFFMENGIYTTIGFAIFSLILIMILIANYYGTVINNAITNRQHFVTIKHNHEKLKERFFPLFERAPVGIYYYNEDLEFEDINTHFIQMNKAKDKKSLIGTSLHNLNNSQIIQAHINVFEGKIGNYRGPFALNNNQNLYVKLSTVPMISTDGKVAGGITIINDITNEVMAKETMLHNAYYDMLTNIPNRTLLVDKLKKIITIKRDHEKYAALLFLDIDNFKKINETYGHDTGDHLLKQVVHRIKNIINKDELFARISGDKFVILIPSLDMNKGTSEKMLETYISTINSIFTQALNVVGEEYHLSFSIGIVLFNTNDSTAFNLLKCSETAMYEAKRNARGTSKFYQSSMSFATKEKLTLENDIHKAIKNSEFSMYYQPKLDIKTNKIIGAEALARWKHPKKGFISPDSFILAAEENGMIIKLEEWIFNKTIEEIKILSEQRQGFNLEHISINVSTIHFLQPHFVEKIMLLIKKHKVSPTWIELEFTQSGIIENINDAIEKIKKLKAFGFTFSLDDFGTGYSSLSYLKELPVDGIKIDQSFIMDMHNNQGDTTIVETIIAIGQKFNLKVLAEGVEKEETLAQLAIMNCDHYQGYYAYKPMPFDAFLQVINSK